MIVLSKKKTNKPVKLNEEKIKISNIAHRTKSISLPVESDKDRQENIVNHVYEWPTIDLLNYHRVSNDFYSRISGGFANPFSFLKICRVICAIAFFQFVTHAICLGLYSILKCDSIINGLNIYGRTRENLLNVRRWNQYFHLMNVILIRYHQNQWNVFTWISEKKNRIC